MIERLARGRIHYGWLVVSVTFVTLITTAGFRATPGVLIVPLQDEFHWSRDLTRVSHGRAARRIEHAEQSQLAEGASLAGVS